MRVSSKGIAAAETGLGRSGAGWGKMAYSSKEKFPSQWKTTKTDMQTRHASIQLFLIVSKI